MKTISFLASLISISILLSSCGFKDGEETATKTLKSLLDQRIIEGGLLPEGAHNNQFWKNFPKEQWQAYSQVMDTTHGKLKSYKISRAQARGRMKGISSEGWVGFIIDTTYEKGVSAQEQINFHRAGKGRPFLVISHQIKSETLRAYLENQKNAAKN